MPLALRVGSASLHRKECPYTSSCAPKKRSARPAARAGRLLISQETRKPLSSVSTQPVPIATAKTSAVESRLLPVLGFVFSAASSWPESLIAVLGRRAIHVLFFGLRPLCAATSIVCAPRPSTPSLLQSRNTPHTGMQRNAAPFSPRPQSGERGYVSGDYRYSLSVKRKNSRILRYGGPFGC